MLDYLEDVPDFGAALDDYFDEFDDIDTGPDARGPEYFLVDDSSGRLWTVRQVLKDPEDERGYQLVAHVDLDASDAAGEVRLRDLEVRY